MKSFLKTTVRVWAVVLSLFAVNMGVAGAGQAVNHARHQDTAVDLRHRQRFYKMIEGRVPAEGATVDVALATDLKRLLGPQDGGSLPPAIQNFQGTSTSYGGITGVIGFDPFDHTGLGCRECGPLRDSVLTSLQKIKDNNDASLFRAVKTRSAGYTLTPFAISWIMWLLVLWLFVSIIVMFIARSVNRPGYDALGPNPPLALTIQSPLYWGVYHFLQDRETDAADQKLRDAFPQQMATVDSVNRLLGHVSGPRALEMKNVRDQVLDQLRSQITTGGSPADEIELQHSMEELLKCREFLNARAEARHELTETENS